MFKKKIAVLLVSFFSVFSLVGCIGETYDFNPPVITLMSDSSVILEQEGLVQSNLDWEGEYKEPIKKETKDIFALAKKQKEIILYAGDTVDIMFNSHDFNVEKLTIILWKDNKKIEIATNNEGFNLPKELQTGKYIFEMNLHTDNGYAQYVGNIKIFSENVDNIKQIKE